MIVKGNLSCRRKGRSGELMCISKEVMTLGYPVGKELLLRDLEIHNA